MLKDEIRKKNINLKILLKLKKIARKKLKEDEIVKKKSILIIISNKTNRNKKNRDQI
jgi:hypothetical protein